MRDLFLLDESEGKAFRVWHPGTRKVSITGDLVVHDNGICITSATNVPQNPAAINISFPTLENVVAPIAVAPIPVRQPSDDCSQELGSRGKPREDVPLAAINTDSSSSSEANPIDLRVEIPLYNNSSDSDPYETTRTIFTHTDNTTSSSSPKSVHVVTSTFQN